ncbi:hypothetical protein SLEP1_g2118 [Rubroshorea leprosula]|uniref:Uncharacterized protein n=1 Tax=Rubroshorea leprosula TaxID=152421 RepID=A0AAV5HKJ2_9ROSI|nr:hypothetical protein SLEP1_g2118 [Rubroshorea leprosula]
MVTVSEPEELKTKIFSIYTAQKHGKSDRNGSFLILSCLSMK